MQLIACVQLTDRELKSKPDQLDCADDRVREREREREKKKSNDSQTKTRLNLVENFENAAVKSTGSALKILEGRIRLSSRAILADLKTIF